MKKVKKAVKCVEPKEAAVHAAVVEHLTLRCRPDCFWFHVPNGEKRDLITAVKLKRMGVKAGVPDLVFLLNGQMRFLELKRSKAGRPSPNQKVVRTRIEQAGGVWAVAGGIDEALSVISGWGLFMVGNVSKRSVVA